MQEDLGEAVMTGGVSKSVGLFHPGTQHSWQVARALQELEALAWYATSIYYRPSHFPYNLFGLAPSFLKHKLEAEARRFHHPRLDDARIRTFGFSEFMERIARRGGLHGLAKRIDRLGNFHFGRMVARLADRTQPDVLWGFDNASLEVLKSLQGRSTAFILDKTIGDWREYNLIMDRVAADYPDYFLSDHRHVPSSTIARQQEEYERASVILVGSDYCGATLMKHGGDGVRSKVRTLPYCYDSELFTGAPRRRAERGAVRFLFLGQVSPRKGIHLLLRAFERLPASAATLTIVGSVQIPQDVLLPFQDRIRLVPSVPRSAIPAVMAEHDCLVIPSYFEGAPITLFEACAMGLTNIRSRECGFVPRRETGIELSALNEEAVYDAMLRVVDEPDRMNEWSAGALAVAEDYKFDWYRSRIADLLAVIG